VGETEITIETGKIARQADGAVLIRQGDTVILVTATAASRPREGTDFFPLTVEYRERLSAAGRFPGGYRKKEGRTSDREIIACRLTDRTIRPLFPEGYRCEVQVLATVLSYQPGTDPEVLAITGGAMALHLSGIPFDGPVAGLRLTCTADGHWLVFAGAEDRTDARAELVISLGPKGLVMMEGEARELPEAELVKAIRVASDAVGPLHALMEQARAAAGKAKRAFAPPAADAEVVSAIRELATERLREALRTPGKHQREEAVGAVKEAVRRELSARLSKRAVAEDAARVDVASASVDLAGVDLAGVDRAAADPAAAGPAAGLAAAAGEALSRLEHELLRRAIIEDGVRADGRSLTGIRPIVCEAGLIPRVHGSALFTRGETQALVVTTLGTGRDEQETESIYGTVKERFQLHYAFPPYSVGEVRPLRGPGRREIGHGNLARRAIEAILPTAEAFPYTIKIESEITESNGSSSMATVCGGCLALMDAGVPVRRPVAGIAMGLVQEGDAVAILSDILGVEDHLGDMDFKVAGTTEGVTAVQLDNKVGSLPLDLLERALAQAHSGRVHILAEMAKTLAGPRKQLSTYAPRIEVMKIRPHRIRDLIGPGGRHIQDLQADAKVKIDVQDDGTVRIYAAEAGSLPHAKRRVWELTGEPEVGKIYRGTVTGVKEFGVFVRLFQGIEGLVHASELAEGNIRDVSSVAAEGETLVVKVLGVEGGRIALSRRQAMGVREEEIEAP
jgi:polyribonucleotide nucleotidyltransferase